MKKIEFDLNKDEFDEQFSSQQLWQQQAAELLVSYLKNIGLQARKCSLSSDKNIPHAHDTILISGGRGTGKSVFLKNAESIWNERIKNKPCCPKLSFAPPIDPTLLQDHDSFTHVIVAHLYNKVMNVITHSNCLQPVELEKKKQYFFESLRQLAEALEQPGDKSEHSGLDKIIQYSSGVKIESLFHKFVEAVIKIIDCDAIVLPIDDVDMALNQAYPVLEEIRRRFSCPYLIPLVSGDMALYEHLVKKEFNSCLKNKLSDAQNITPKTDEMVENLTNAYLTKVLPHHYRISLTPLSDLLNRLSIITNDSHSLSFEQYQEQLKDRFFGAINGEEKSADYAQPSSAREVVQLVRLLPPQEKEDTNNNVSEAQWQALLVWSEAKHHGAGYVLARSVLQNSTIARLSQLMNFNIMQQCKERLPWAGYDFISEQKAVVENFDAKNNLFLLEGTLDGNILRSMPPLEMHTNNMTITDEQAKQEKNNPLMLDIYTHKAYYNTLGNQQRKIFFSRAFELLSTSLLMINSSNINDAEWNHQFKEIFDKPPFYSIHALNPTKLIDEPIAYQTPTSQYSDSDKNDEQSDYSDLLKKINTWKENNHEKINDYLSSSGHLISLLAAVFNKTFTQLNLLRAKYHSPNEKEIKKDKLIDSILRFHYILINSFGFFIKDREVISANLAIGTNISTLRSRREFASRSNPYRTNVSWIDKAEHSKSASFLQAIISHPVFSVCHIDADGLSGIIENKVDNEKEISQHPNSSFGVGIEGILKPQKENNHKYSMSSLKTIENNINKLLQRVSRNDVDINQEKLWEELKNEVDENRLDKYPKNQRRIYNILKSKYNQ